MFGLTFEKLLVITILAGVIIGPRRLPVYAALAAEYVREWRAFLASSRARAERELGTTLPDVRDYDPRRVVRDALRDPS